MVGTKQNPLIYADEQKLDDRTRKRLKLVESSTGRLPQRARVSDQKKNNKETQIFVYKRRSPNQFIDRWSTEK